MDTKSDSLSSAEEYHPHSDAEDSASPPELIVVEQLHPEDEDNSTPKGVCHSQLVAAGGLQANKSLTPPKTDSWESIYDQMFSYHSDNTLPPGMDSAQTKQFRERADKFLVQDGELYHKFSAKDKEIKLLKAIRNEKERLEIIKKCHEDCNKLNLHNGRDKTIDSIRQNYYWKGIINDVKSYIKRCKSCEHRKPTPYQHYPPFLSIPEDCYKRPRLSSMESDHAIHCNIGSPNLSPAADGKPVQFFLVRNETNEPSSQEASPLRRLAVNGTVERSSPQVYYVKSTPAMSNGLDHSHEYNNLPGPVSSTTPTTSHNHLHNGSVIQNGRPASGVIRSPGYPSTRATTGNVSRLTNDSVWEEIIEGCALSRTVLSTAVVSAMQNGLNFKADPNQMRNSVDHFLTQSLDLPEQYSVILTPSRAVAYILAVASCMCCIDPMSIQTINSLRSLRPLVIVHDASCCQDSTLPPLASIVGGFCWFLGGPNTPMDRHTLSMAIASNRVAAVVHEPQLQGTKSSAMSLKYLTALCHNSTVSVIVDNADIDITRDTLAATIKEQVTCNIDASIIPMSTIGGPGEACMLIVTHSLYRELCQNFDTLQNLVAFPLTLPVHETMGALATVKLCFEEIVCD